MIKYTQGNEYLLNGKSYIGPYVIVGSDVNYAYAGKTYIFGVSKKLTPVIDNTNVNKCDVGIYSNLNSAYYNTEDWTPTYSYPVITNTNINDGYIYRYFTQKANGVTNPIIEISKDDYQRSNLYNFVKLKWYITGSDSIVSELNRNSITDGMKIISKLNTVLQNPLELKKSKLS